MSAQIGGILSTNAGGNNTVRYGNATRPRAGVGGCLCRRSNMEWTEASTQGQYRILSPPAFSRSRGDARHYHGSGVETGAPADDLVVAFCAIPICSVRFGPPRICFGRTYGTPFRHLRYLSGEGVHLVSKHFPDTQIPLRSKDRPLCPAGVGRCFAGFWPSGKS